MGSMTMTQKILAYHAGKKEVRAGELINAKVDFIMANDITGPVAIREFENSGFAEVFDKDRIALVLDHFVPNKDIKSAEQSKVCRSFASCQQLSHFYDVGKMGIEHVLLPEQGMVTAGDVVIGADSHTCTYGAVGAFSTGVGSTDVAAAMATGEAWFKVPAAIKVLLKGKLPAYVSGKDVILHLIGRIGVDGALYKSLEFTGEGLGSMPIDDRFTIANMAIEAGAKNGIFPVDSVAEAYLVGRGERAPRRFAADADAVYESVVEIDLSALEPTVAFPHLPENTRLAKDAASVRVDQVVIGSCTNGRISDMKIAADLLRGKQVAAGVRVIIIPGTQDIYRQCLEMGYIRDFIEAGCAISTPTCGPCLGGYMGILADGEKCLSTTNRNFVGRMGHTGSEVYLASPSVAAATALTGSITDPRYL
ncbi:MAG: 3-isopropylmalate dehydratase large subunit [Clostridia bacterium]|nr:3-isopropylmalate dehydratase large subunit [Clostridia bacterium]